ncbi:methyl-CpG binding domain protein [Trifolium pratense]|uniref:Methyl-CpG binding domain protein n=3 Tax=Trifolium pratense TaxID=57577 RepID=A0A2K3N567_TRIPR|nr:methyl-CpG binding domain protein [Trifolium pratense]CAJ2666666.1 unnamed protein product [Trifolium pratense]
MEDTNSDECLPPGWTVKVNVRKNGKIDKYYFPPSSDQKFNSMVGVFRYLDNAKKKARIHQKISNSNNSADITTKATLSVSSDENSGLDMTASDQQIPRRTSKRLAGIKAGPPPELKIIRARRDVVKQSGEDETIVNAERSTDSFPNDQDKPFPALDDVSETKFNAENTENKMEIHATEKECVEVLKNGDNVDAKLDHSNEFPLKELLTDPCIAFAIQTLTGETFETSKDTQKNSTELESKQHCENSASTKEHNKKINVTHDDPDGRKALSSPEHVSDAQIDKVGLSSVNLCKSEERRNVC